MSRMYDYYNDPEEKMLEALSEHLDVDYEIISLIDPQVGEDTSSSADASHYGYYFEFPQFDDLDDEIQKQISRQLIDEIPFGETVYMDDGELSNTQADPLGWRSDYESELHYIRSVLPAKELVDEITRIERALTASTDDLTKKALVFAAFSLTESHVRRQVWNSVPVLSENIKDSGLRNMVKEDLSHKLRAPGGREKVYKKLTSKKLPKIPHYDPVRNTLAHDIGSGRINANALVVKDLKDNDYEVDIKTLFDKLRNFINDFS